MYRTSSAAIILIAVFFMKPVITQKRPADKLPNIIIINMDDMGYGDTELMKHYMVKAENPGSSIRSMCRCHFMTWHMIPENGTTYPLYIPIWLLNYKLMQNRQEKILAMTWLKEKVRMSVKRPIIPIDLMFSQIDLSFIKIKLAFLFTQLFIAIGFFMA